MLYQHIYKEINTHQTIFYAWFDAMHTRIDIALCNLTEAEGCVLIESICAEIQRIESICNRFDEKSELSAVNLFAATQPYKISSELYQVLFACKQFKRMTFGAFDITIQSFNGYKNGVNDIVLDESTSTVYFANKNVQIDLNGYIKGYALDKAKELCQKNKCTDALMNFGNSSVCGLGNHPNGEGWQINLPNNNQSVALKNECMSNSGNTMNHTHIIDPKQWTFINHTNVTSVLCRSAAHAEVLSTALCVCEPEQINQILTNFKGTLPNTLEHNV